MAKPDRIGIVLRGQAGDAGAKIGADQRRCAWSPFSLQAQGACIQAELLAGQAAMVGTASARRAAQTMA